VGDTRDRDSALLEQNPMLKEFYNAWAQSWFLDAFFIGLHLIFNPILTWYNRFRIASCD
jgi:hypothetical protein